MQALLVIVALVAAVFGLYLLARRRHEALSEDLDDAETPDAGVPVKVKRGPGGKSGAVAMAEPDKEEQE